MHRFHLAAGLLLSETVVLPEDVGYQITRVLRMRPGAQIALFSGDGREHLAVVKRVESPGGVTVRDTLGIVAITWLLAFASTYIAGEVRSPRRTQTVGTVGGT